jgi:hypothetical protein
MLKKILSNMNAIQRMFVFIPIVFTITTLALKNFYPNFPEDLGGFIDFLAGGLGMEFEFSSLQSAYADIAGFSIIVSCLIGFFFFKTNETPETKEKH